MPATSSPNGAPPNVPDQPITMRTMLITLTVMLGLIMAIIDSTIVNVALDTIAGNLGATTDEVAWVATGYILASVIIMPLNGWLTAYFGRKRFYAVALAVFTIASLLCGTATSIWQLVFYRVIQGIGGGALQPTAQAILFETFPPAKRGAAMAIFGMGAMVGPAVGPLLGGYLVDNYSWPLIFFVNIPIGIAAILMTLAFIPNPSYLEKPKSGIDWTGLALMTAGLGSLQYVLERGQHDGWFSSTTIVVLILVCVVTLTLFIWKMLRSRAPLVDLRVFRYRTFTIGNILGIIMGFGLFGTALILPLFMQSILGFTAYDTGLALLPGAISTAFAMLIAGRINNRVDGRILIAIGFISFAISTWQLGSLSTQAGYWSIFWPRIIQGIGLGFLFVPLSTLSLSQVALADMANATGIYSLIRQLGGSLGIAVLTTLLQTHIAYAWSALAAGITQTHGVSVGTLAHLVAQQASMIAYNYLFQFCAVTFILALPLIFFMRMSKRDAALEAAAMAALE